MNVSNGTAVPLARNVLSSVNSKECDNSARPQVFPSYQDKTYIFNTFSGSVKMARL